MRNRRSIFILFAIFLLLLAGCHQPPADNNNNNNNNNKSNPTNTVVKDDLGREVTLARAPQRLISLAPSITEILFALGLGNRVVGVTTYCNYPAATAQITKVGDTLHPNLEQIIALKPELVLITTASQLQQLMEKLAQAGIPVYVLKEKSIEGTFHSIDMIGQLTGQKLQSERLLETLRARLSAITKRVQDKPAPKVFFMVGSEPLITAGRDAFITDAIKLAGGQSISADTASEWPAYSVETVIARTPEVIIYTAWHNDGGITAAKLPEGFAVTPATRNKRVHQIDGDLILRPGPRIIDGLEQLAQLFHPEVN